MVSYRPHRTLPAWGGDEWVVRPDVGRSRDDRLPARVAGEDEHWPGDLLLGERHNHDDTVIDTAGTVLSEHRIDPERSYQPRTKIG